MLESQGRKLLLVAALLLGLAVAAPYIAQGIDRFAHPPVAESAGPSLRAVGPVMKDNPAAGTLVPYIEYSIYGFCVLAFTAAFFLTRRRTAPVRPDDSATAQEREDLPSMAETDITTTTQIRPESADLLTLSGRSRARVEASARRHAGNSTRTRALDIAQTVAIGADDAGDTTTTRPMAAAKDEKTVQGRYELVKPLASGGAGVVYKARDSQLKRTVAMKQLFTNLSTKSSHAQRFIEEAHSLAALSHPNIVPIYDLIVDDEYWFVMEFLPGGSLVDRLKKDGFIEHELSVPMIRDVAKALATAHRKGFIHRDIKPANVLFNEDGEVKVADFGIAKSESSTVETTIGVTLGSPAYLSPEQAEGVSVTAKADIYSLGVTAYEVLTGERPFGGEYREVLAKHITQNPEPPIELNPDLPQELSDFVLRMMAKDPEARPTAAAVVEALEQWTPTGSARIAGAGR
jgi:tRNA A-37 threonylcarbamoyl transferase component Bud32